MEAIGRLVIADENTLFREGLCRLLEESQRYKVIGEAADGKQAVQLAASLRPDIVLLDMVLPELHGLEVLRRIRETPGVRGVLMASTISKKAQIQALRLDARGLILKGTSTRALLECLGKVMQGQVWLPEDTLPELKTEGEKLALSPSFNATLLSLTSRERDIISAVAAGYSNKEIAASLGISYITVKHHITNIFMKIGVSSRLELALYAIRNNLSGRQ